MFSAKNDSLEQDTCQKINYKFYVKRKNQCLKFLGVECILHKVFFSMQHFLKTN